MIKFVEPGLVISVWWEAGAGYAARTSTGPHSVSTSGTGAAVRVWWLSQVVTDCFEDTKSVWVHVMAF